MEIVSSSNTNKPIYEQIASQIVSYLLRTRIFTRRNNSAVLKNIYRRPPT